MFRSGTKTLPRQLWPAGAKSRSSCMPISSLPLPWRASAWALAEAQIT
jgi:hypothetical protein